MGIDGRKLPSFCRGSPRSTSARTPSCERVLVQITPHVALTSLTGEDRFRCGRGGLPDAVVAVFRGVCVCVVGRQPSQQITSHGTPAHMIPVTLTPLPGLRPFCV